MKNEYTLEYKDSLNYSPIDVVKGIDLITKQVVNADDKVPPGIGHEPMPKCKFCTKFAGDFCQAFLPTPYKAYGEMRANSCHEFCGNNEFNEYKNIR